MGKQQRRAPLAGSRRKPRKPYHHETGLRAAERAEPPGIAKAPTGIQGLDEITGGGLPRGRLTLVESGPAPERRFFGDLRDRQRVIDGLDPLTVLRRRRSATKQRSTPRARPRNTA